MGLAVIAVEGLEVEVELAKVFGLETVHLQFDGDEAVEAAMEEQQIECEVATAYLYGIFGADETEVAPEFDEELPESREQAVVQVGLAVGIWQIEKLDKIGVLENAADGITMSLSHRW